MILLTIKAVNKDIKTKENFSDNHVHNILRLFDDWLNFSLTTNENKKQKKRDY